MRKLTWWQKRKQEKAKKEWYAWAEGFMPNEVRFEHTPSERKLFFDIAWHIHIEPNTYNQDDWLRFDDEAVTKNSCGTTACIAGWAVTINEYDADLWRAYESYNRWFHDESLDYEDRLTPGTVQNRAAEALGLDAINHTYLFAGSWKPHSGLTVPEALVLMGNGADVFDVSWEDADRAQDEREYYTSKASYYGEDY